METRVVIVVLCVLALGSCASVNPEADFQRASSRVGERTGATDLYDPRLENQIAEKVDAALADGLALDEAVRVALLNNHAFQSLFLQIGVSRADVVQSGLLTNPSLSLSARFPEGGGRSNISFGFAQEIADLWQIPVRKKVAQAELERTILQVVKAGTDLVSQVKAAYFKALVAQQTATIRQDNLALAERSLELAQRRFEAGEATILDVNLVQATMLDVRTQAVAARRDQRTSKAQLARLLGLSASLDTIDLNDALPSAEGEIEDDATLTAHALKARLDVQAAARDLDKAENEVKRQKRAVWPSLSVGIDGERPDRRAPRSLKPVPPKPPLGSVTLPSASQTLQDYVVQQVKAQQGQLQSLEQSTKDLFFQQLDEKRARDLEKRQAIDLLLGPSLQVTLPIWDQNQAQVAKAQFLMRQKQKDFAELLESVVEEVVVAAETARSAQELVRLSSEEALPLAQKNVETAQRVYEAGEESILALLAAQNTLLSQREAQVSFLGDYASASAELERALGGRSVPEEVFGLRDRSLSEKGTPKPTLDRTLSPSANHSAGSGTTK